MKQPVAATTSVVLHAAIIAGAALIVFPLRLEKQRQDNITLELVELPAAAPAAPDKSADPTGSPAENRQDAANEPVTATSADAALAQPAAVAEPSPPQPSPASVPAPQATLREPYTPAPASAIVAVNPPLLAPTPQLVRYTALLPDSLPTDAEVPAVSSAAPERPPLPSPQPAPAPPAPMVVAAETIRTSPATAPVAVPVPSSPQLPSAPPPAAVLKPARRLDSASLNRQLKQGGDTAPRRGLDRAALGQALVAARPTGASRLTARQRVNLAALIRRQITPCWNPPSIAENPGIVTITLRIQLERSGQVNGTPSVSGVTGGTPQNQAYVTALAGSVRRAVLRCAPLQLPAELYDAWSDVELNFDPRDVL